MTDIRTAARAVEELLQILTETPTEALAALALVQANIYIECAKKPSRDNYLEVHNDILGHAYDAMMQARVERAKKEGTVQ